MPTLTKTTTLTTMTAATDSARPYVPNTATLRACRKAETINGYRTTVEAAIAAGKRLYLATAWNEDGTPFLRVTALANPIASVNVLITKVYQRHCEMVAVLQRRRCARCGELRPLQGHHIIFRSHGRNDRLPGIEMLCPDCHGNIHEGRAKR